MSNIFLRAITGSLFVALMVASTQWPWLFDVLCLVFPALCVWELMRMFGYKIWVSIITVLLVSFISTSYLEYIIQIEMTFYWIALVLIGVLIFSNIKKKGNSNTAITFLGLLYIIISFYCYFHLSYVSTIRNVAGETRSVLILPMLIFIWTNDSFAYLIGRKIGKTPLAPSISPKKTIEGTLGGLVYTILVAILLKYIYVIPEGNWFYVWALLVSVSATVGDLLESKVKRIAGVKDSGNLLPGHGGFLDRLDAMLLCSIVSFLFFKFVPLF